MMSKLLSVAANLAIVFSQIQPQCGNNANPNDDCGGFANLHLGDQPICGPLFAGKTDDIGQVCAKMSINGEAVEFTYSVEGDHCLEELHFYAGDDPNGYPSTKKGNPKLGKFPYKLQHQGQDCLQEHMFVVPVSEIDSQECLLDLCQYCNGDINKPSFYVIAHAKESGGESAFLFGEQLNEKGSWAMRAKFDFNVGPCIPPVDPQETCGMVHEGDLSVEQLEANGWERCFTSTYGSRWNYNNVRTDCQADAANNYLFVGAIQNSNPDEIFLGAYVTGEPFTGYGNWVVDCSCPNTRLPVIPSGSDFIANNYGVYWYFYSGSVGFASTTQVRLCSCDYDPGCAVMVKNEDRMCWHTNNGGWRAGENKWLNGDHQWTRVVYRKIIDQKQYMPGLHADCQPQ